MAKLPRLAFLPPVSLAALAVLAALTGACSSSDDGSPSNQSPGQPGGVTGLPGDGTWFGPSECPRARDRDVEASPLRCAAPATSAFAVCSCGALTANNTLTVDRRGETGEWGALGVDGAYTTSAPVVVGGDLRAGASILSNNTHQIGGDLLCGASFGANADVRVAGDAVLGGPVNVPNPRLYVDGTLTLPAEADLSGVADAGSVVRRQVRVEAPCDCTEPFDVGGAVAAARDEARQGGGSLLANAPDAMVGLSEPADLTYACGRHYVNGVTPNNTLRLRIEGKVTLYVDGDVRTAAPFTVELGPEAELDLYVGGAFQPNNTVVMGAAARPDALRLYVAGPVTTAAPVSLYGSLYAPASSVTANNTIDLWGAAFAGSFTLAAPFVVHEAGPSVDARGCLQPEI
jgi:hypothetical protein